MLCHCSSLARACDRPQPFPMSMCGFAAKSDCLTCCLSAYSCSFMPRDKGGIGRTGKKVRAAAIRRATDAAPEQEGVGSSSTLGPPAGDAFSQWVMSSTGTSAASSSNSPATEDPVAPKSTPADEQPIILSVTRRLNAPRPLACPPAALSREDSKRGRWVYHPQSIQTLLSILPSARCTCATPARWAAAATLTSSDRRVVWRRRRICLAPASREHS